MKRKKSVGRRLVRRLGVLCLFAAGALTARGATVVYAAESSAGTGDGSSWANAIAWKDAIAAAAANADGEIWIKGDVTVSAIVDSVTVSGNLVIRGGFDGTEIAAADRQSGARATIDGGDAYDPIKVAVTGSLAFERVNVTRGAIRGVYKSGAGSLSFTDCALNGNGRTIGHNTSNAIGNGLYATGAGTVTLTRCDVNGNGPYRYSQNGAGGWGAYVNGASRVFIDDCNFVTNGVWLDANGNGWGTTHKGLALYLNGSPATIRNTRFAGNVSKPSGADSGGAVYFAGACGATAMTNCTFVGNQDLINGTAGNGGGICIFYPNTDAATLDVSDCTFAYNLSQSRMSAAGLVIRRGAAHVTDCEFFHNVLGYALAHGWGSDVSVHGAGTLSIEKTNVSSLKHSVSCETAGNLDFDTATMTANDPAFVSDVLYVEGLISYGTSLAYAKSEATYVKLGLLDATKVTPAPSKPDIGAGSVLYVKADAAGTGDGSSWTDAFTSLSNALAAVSAVKKEIWIAGDLTPTEDTGFVRISNDVTVRGGFAGTETAASDRAAGARSTLDGANARDLVKLSVKSDATATFERCVFTRAKYRAVYKRDCGSLAFADCRFLNNGRAQLYSGRGIYAPAAYGCATLSVTNCAFEGQMNNSRNNGSGSGHAIYVAGHERFVCDDTLFASNGTVICSSKADNREMKGAAIYGYATPVTVRRTRFAGNIGASRTSDSDGGIVRLESFLGNSAFTNCAFVGNYAFNYRDGLTDNKCGALVLLPQSTDVVDIENCTFAYNMSHGPGSPGGLNVHAGTVNVHDSIFWHNIDGDLKTEGIGGDIDVKGGVVNLSHSIVTGKGVDCCHGVSATSLVIDDATVYTTDPGFVTPYEAYSARLNWSGTEYINPGTGFTYAFLAGIDVHLLSPQKYYLNDGTVGPATNAYSSAIDKGDASVACVEPAPNGGIVNLGAYGNTPQASLTAVGQPAVTTFAIDYPDGYSRPYANLTMGLSSGSGYFATVVVTCKVAGVVYATKTFSGVQNGDVVTWGVPHYFDPTDELEISYGVTADDATPVFGKTDTVPTGKVKPAFCGHGGGATVVHVREGADCAMDGSNWEDAFPTLAAAAAAGFDGKTEVWIARETEDSAVAWTLASPLAVRGGFAGTEDAADGRAADTRTTFAYGNAADGWTVSNGSGATLEIDRLVFHRATEHAVTKSGAGDLILRDCRFSRNGVNVKESSGKGLYVPSGSSASITVTNCVFDYNMCDQYYRGENGGDGAAIYVSGCSRITIDDSLFASNGIQTVENNSSYYCFFGGMRGAALYSYATPVTARRCRFTANALGNRGAGGIVALNGNCNGSAFTNCVFVGNFERMDNTGSASDWGGALAINMDATSRTCDIEGCTIAYNVTDSQRSAGGLTVINGNVTVKDSIIWSNFRNKYRSASYAEDIETKGGTCTVSHSLVTGTGTDKCRGAAAGYLTLDADTVYTDDPTFVSSFDDFLTLFTTNATSVTQTSLCKYATLGALDVHLLSAERYYLNDGTVGSKVATSSPAIDKGDPTLACVEPAPNGNRVNLGAYGNTPQASATPAGQPSAELALTLPTEYSRPRATLTMGIAKGSDYKAEVTLYCRTGTVELASKTWTGVQNGAVLVWDVPYYFADGTPVTVSYSVTADGADPVSSSGAVTSTGTFPAFYGKGGGANVIHVRAGADCLQTGADWTDAYADLATALQALDGTAKTEVWVAQGEYVANVSVLLSRELNLRGGFAGTENAASERPAGLYGTVSHGGTLTGVCFENGAGMPLYVERMTFAGALDRGFKKTGAGDVTLVDCRFERNGPTTHNDGRGAYFGGSGVGTVALTNCVFAGNASTAASDYCANGAGAYFESCAAATLANCLFVTNGLNFKARGTYTGRGAGAAIFASGTPILCERCRFAANSASSNGGGIVRIDGSSYGSAFVNCAFVGNYETRHWNQEGADTTGSLVVNLNDRYKTVTVRNCTFAHNLDTGRYGPGGLNVVQGTVTATDCVFWENRNGYLESEQQIHDTGYGSGDEIKVASAGFLYCTNTLIAATNFPSCQNKGTLVFGGNIVTNADPLFVTESSSVTNRIVTEDNWAHYSAADMPALAAINVHLRGGAGYTDETTGAFVDAWASQGRSPAQDAGTRHPRREPRPTGGWTDLGAYGNSPWTTLPPRSGLSVFAR